MSHPEEFLIAVDRKLIVVVLAGALVVAGAAGAYLFRDALFSTSPPDPQLVDQAISAGLTPEQRPDGRAAELTLAEERAFGWVELGPLRGEHEAEWTWVAPDGEGEYQNTQTIGEEGVTQERVRSWSWMPIRSAESRPQTGTWEVHMALDGQRFASQSFRLVEQAVSDQCGETLYADDFEASGSTGWVERESEHATWRYTDDGRYRISTSRAGNSSWSWAPIRAGQLSERFCLDVTVAQPSESAEPPTAAMGLVFAGEQDAPALTTFGISPSQGAYRVRQRNFDTGESSNLVDWRNAAAVEGSDARNRLRVMAWPDRAALFVNGQQVGEVELDTAGALGVFVESFETTPVAATFDDFTIRAMAEERR